MHPCVAAPYALFFAAVNFPFAAAHRRLIGSKADGHEYFPHYAPGGGQKVWKSFHSVENRLLRLMPIMLNFHTVGVPTTHGGASVEIKF